MSVVTAEDLKVLYEADLREEVGNLLVSKEGTPGAVGSPECVAPDGAGRVA